MRTFVLIYFWGMAVLTFIRIMELAVREWPEQRKPRTLGLAAAETILGACLMIWAALVLWK